MGRPKGGKNRKYSYEFKLKVVQDHDINNLSLHELERKYEVDDGVISRWIYRFLLEGTEGLKPKKKGNPFSALHTSKSLSREERLELENLKLKIENERLKKGYLVKGGGLNKEYVSVSGANTRSSKN